MKSILMAVLLLIASSAAVAQNLRCSDRKNILILEENKRVRPGIPYLARMSWGKSYGFYDAECISVDSMYGSETLECYIEPDFGYKKLVASVYIRSRWNPKYVVVTEMIPDRRYKKGYRTGQVVGLNCRPTQENASY